MRGKLALVFVIALQAVAFVSNGPLAAGAPAWVAQSPSPSPTPTWTPPPPDVVTEIPITSFVAEGGYIIHRSRAARRESQTGAHPPFYQVSWFAEWPRFGMPQPKRCKVRFWDEFGDLVYRSVGVRTGREMTSTAVGENEGVPSDRIATSVTITCLNVEPEDRP